MSGAKAINVYKAFADDPGRVTPGWLVATRPCVPRFHWMKQPLQTAGEIGTINQHVDRCFNRKVVKTVEVMFDNFWNSNIKQERVQDSLLYTELGEHICPNYCNPWFFARTSESTSAVLEERTGLNSWFVVVGLWMFMVDNKSPTNI